MRNDILLTEPLLKGKGRREEHVSPVPERSDGWSLWSQLTFSWVDCLMATGFQRQLEHFDMLPVPSDITPQECSRKVWRLWNDERARLHDKDPSLLRVIVQAYGWTYLLIGMLKATNDALAFVGPLLLHELVSFLDSGASRRSTSYGYLCAAGLGATAAARALLGAHYSYQVARLGLQLRASITTMVFRKALCVSMAERSRFSTGEIQTLMAVDADRVVNLCGSAHELWSLPLQICVALLLLYIQVQFAFLAGLAVVLLLIPFNRWLAVRISAASEKMMKDKDDRVRRTGEMLAAIRTLKMYAWEDLFAQRIAATRRKELQGLAIRKYLDALCVYCWACTPILFSLCTFSLFALLGHQLTAATVFTSLALFNVVLAPLNSFPWVINGIVEAGVSLGRLRRFLASPDLNPEWATESSPRSHAENSHSPSPDETWQALTRASDAPTADVLVMTSGSFTWAHSGAEDELSLGQSRPLQGINLAVPDGALVVVLGEVGAGKSSLLEAILGEMRCVSGQVAVQGAVTYAPQVPWIHSGTLRENILFGQKYSEERYHQVLHACALDVDTARMPAGDLSEIGERGLNLSGGQKARIALARALYRPSRLVLLDDPLSAVDAQVAQRLLIQALRGPPMAGRACILCTHHPQAVPLADTVLVMERGQIAFSGRPQDLPLHLQPARSATSASSSTLTSSVPSASFPALDDDSISSRANSSVGEAALLAIAASSQGTGSSSEQPQQLPGLPHAERNPSRRTEGRQAARDKPADGAVQPSGRENAHLQGAILVSADAVQPMGTGDELDRTVAAEGIVLPAFGEQERRGAAEGQGPVEEEAREVGSVRAEVYRQYGRAVGWAVVALIGASLALMQASRNGTDLWLSHWVDSTSGPGPDQPVSFYLQGLGLLALANSLFTLGRAFSFAYGGLRAAERLHTRLLHQILQAPVDFFDRNPSGRILNRFSSDQYMVDDSLPFIANILLANCFSLLGILLILVYAQWTFALLLLPLGHIYRAIQRYYRATSRELRRLDSTSRSPIYATFSESLEGATTIRAFAAQARLAQLNESHVAHNQRAAYSELAASLWLTIRLQTMAAAVVTFISAMAVIGHSSSILSPAATGTAGVVGLSLSYALPIVSLLNDLLTSFTETEKEMVSVERVQQYLDLRPEAESPERPLLSQTWSTTGAIEFRHVSMRYRPDLPLVLDRVSFSIPGGSKVGIAGRTGAGKSSILNALFRLRPISEGLILIDGVDICHLALRDLRTHMTVIPQSPFLFHGSLRENLDPARTQPDTELWEVLRKCHLAGLASGMGGLDAILSEGGASLSLGEQQLLCLARALLRQTRILCLDEYTANVDPTTAAVLQATIDGECKHATVVTIAHRIGTLLALPRVLLMDHGHLVEDGNPQELLGKPHSQFASLAKVN